MTTYGKPTYHSPIFNSTSFSTAKSTKTPQKLQKFLKGIRTPFIEFTGDNSVQLQAAEKTSIEYLTQNIQLNVQPFKQNNYVIQNGSKSIYLPQEKPADGYTVQIFNSSDEPIMLVAHNYKMYNSFYAPKGENSIAFFPKHMAILKFFENAWSLLIF
jgi:hypothetical protein